MSMYEKLVEFKNYLINEEKSAATIGKYIHDVRVFLLELAERELTKQETMAFKHLLTEQYAPASVNSMLTAVNCYLNYIGRSDCCVKLLKVQRQIFASEKKELTVSEYRKLLKAAKGSRMEYIIQTIGETGIRVSELKYITVEAVRQSRALVNCKNKNRIILIPSSLKSVLLEYIKKAGIRTGRVFVTRNGQPLNRSNIWREMKALYARAGVSKEKIFPHNLRHLFARTFYSVSRDIVKLADILGHSSINTTRIYTTETGRQHFECLEKIHCRLTT